MIHQHCSAGSQTRTLSTTIHSDEKMNHNQTLVLHQTDGNLRSLCLNRPQALNALNSEMIQLISDQMKKWERSEASKVVILKGIGRAFCAGGDVVSLVKLAGSGNLKDQIRSIKFFQDEYLLDSFISKMKTPIVCFLNGITMGGGMGLSMHTPFRIATENTRVAMPETTIGLFPDVGATFFLPRLDGEIGTYLGLTGTNLYGWGAFQAGIASHYVPANLLGRLEERLIAISTDTTHDRINEAIEEFAADEIEAETFEREEGKLYDLTGTKRQAIDYCFSPNSMDQILSRLGQVQDGHLFHEDPKLKDWAHLTIQLLRSRSPSSLKITLQAFRLGKKLSIDQCFEMEMKLAAICCDVKAHSDFVTGVTHSLIEKQKTRAPWNPNEILSISEEEIWNKYFSNNKISATAQGIIQDFKAALTSIQSSGALPPYLDYPHSIYNLPTEECIKKFILGDVKGNSGHLAVTKLELMQSLNKLFGNKIGIEAKVADVLGRKTITLGPNQGHVIKWQY